MIEFLVMLACVWLLTTTVQSLLEWWQVKNTEQWYKERTKKL
jgi:hypothetical protein